MSEEWTYSNVRFEVTENEDETLDLVVVDIVEQPLDRYQLTKQEARDLAHALLAMSTRPL